MKSKRTPMSEKVNIVGNEELNFTTLAAKKLRRYDVTHVDENSIKKAFFVYPEKEMKQYKILGDYAISGSAGNGLWGVVKDGNYYSSEISKTAQSWYTDSPFWDEWGSSIDLLLSGKPTHNSQTPVNLWFQVGLYWHWFNEDLPQIEFFRTNDYPIITNTLLDWQRDSLNFFPDIQSRLVELEGPHIVKATEFFVYTYPATSLRGRTSQWVTSFLQKNLTPHLQNSAKRVYISRGDAEARVVENEFELKKFLVERQFECIDNFSSYSIQEKLNVFYNSDLVCSPTGAGLTHCHAMRTGTTVIDFNHSFELLHECGWNNMGTAAGVNWITCSAITGSPSSRSSAGIKRKNNNLFADLVIIDKAINYAIC